MELILQIAQDPAAFPGLVCLGALVGAAWFATVASRWL